MRKAFVAISSFGFTLAAALPAVAQAQTPSISGNGWAALGVIAVLILIVLLIVRVAVGLERRDQRAGNMEDGDEAGVAVLQGIDDEDDDEKPRHRRRA